MTTTKKYITLNTSLQSELDGITITEAISLLQSYEHNAVIHSCHDYETAWLEIVLEVSEEEYKSVMRNKEWENAKREYNNALVRAEEELEQKRAKLFASYG